VKIQKNILASKAIESYFENIKKTGHIILEIEDENKISLSKELVDKLELQAGDKVEVTIKKVISKKEISHSNENPLYEFTKN
jgi:ferric iron reductase protein FhuF